MELKFAGEKGTKDIQVINVTNLDEVVNVINLIKLEPIIFCIKGLKKCNLQRAVDLVCGACYTLNKKLCKLDNYNFLVT